MCRFAIHCSNFRSMVAPDDGRSLVYRSIWYPNRYIYIEGKKKTELAFCHPKIGQVRRTMDEAVDTGRRCRLLK